MLFHNNFRCTSLVLCSLFFLFGLSAGTQISWNSDDLKRTRDVRDEFANIINAEVTKIINTEVNGFFNYRAFVLLEGREKGDLKKILKLMEEREDIPTYTV